MILMMIFRSKKMLTQMFTKQPYLLLCLPVVLSGCAAIGGKTPAPVYDGAGAKGYQEAAPNPVAQPSQPEPQNNDGGIQIKPLETGAKIETTEIQPEALPVNPTEQNLLTPEQEKELAALEKGLPVPIEPTAPGAPIDATIPPVAGQPVAPTDTPPATVPPTPPTIDPAQAVAAPELVPAPIIVPPPVPAPPAFEPLQTFAPMSPVVGALVVAANKSSAQGNVDSATTTIERAIRIEPRNATLFYKLALLRLKQSKPRMAEDLATKSALLASGDNQLKKHSWLLIAKAREMQNNAEGAKEARAKADKF